MSENKHEIKVPIDWNYPENIISRYATNLIVQHSEHEFILSFFEVFPPVLLGSPDEQKKQAAEIKSIKSECVARVVVSADRMADFVRVLQDNLTQYIGKKNQLEKPQ